MLSIRIFFLVFLCSAFSSISLADKPNILLIVSEDNGPELGCYGDKNAKTPILDGLAAEGIRFDRGYVPQAGCSQSRASLLTGLYPHQHGQIGLATWGFRLYRDSIPNLPQLLKKAGYRTGIIGKLHINPEEAFPFDFHKIETANFARQNLDDYRRHAAAFIRASSEPFFLSVNYPDAHDVWLRQAGGLPEKPQTGNDIIAMPYMGLDPAGMREMVADYYNCLSRLDTLVGQLLDELHRSGKAHNTIVIYLGDHGADMLRGKRTSFEGGLRIPLLMRWPGKISPQIRSELVSTIDLMPTLLTAADCPVPDGLPGRALQPLFSPGAVDWRSHLFAEYHTHATVNNFFPQRSVCNQRFKLIENLLPNEVHPDYDNTLSKLAKEAKRRGIAGGLDLPSLVQQAPEPIQSAYTRSRQPPQFELYDLQQDPYEFRNLAEDPQYKTVLAELKLTLNQWRRETNDPLLDPQNLARLTTEVRSIKKKAIAKDYAWGYPDYFFGREPTQSNSKPKKNNPNDNDSSDD